MSIALKVLFNHFQVFLKVDTLYNCICLTHRSNLIFIFLKLYCKHIHPEHLAHVSALCINSLTLYNSSQGFAGYSYTRFRMSHIFGVK